MYTIRAENIMASANGVGTEGTNTGETPIVKFFNYKSGDQSLFNLDQCRFHTVSSLFPAIR